MEIAKHGMLDKYKLEKIDLACCFHIVPSQQKAVLMLEFQLSDSFKISGMNKKLKK